MAIDLCSAQGGNTGPIDCSVKRGRPVKPIVGGKQFTSTDYADPATLQAAILAALKLSAGDANKLFAFPEIGKINIETPASTKGNLPFGPVKRLIKGIPAYTYSVEVGWPLYQKLLAFDGKTIPVFIFDDKNNMWGYRATAAANTPNTLNWKGEMAYVTVEGSGFEDGENVESGVAKISISYLSVNDYERNGTFASLPTVSSGDFKGLKDVMLSEPVAHTVNVYKIKMTIPVPGLAMDLNIYDDFAALIQPLTWTAFTGATFTTAMTITSIALDSALKALTVTFDSTLYTALSVGSKIKLIPPTVAVLDAAAVTGVEIGSIIVTK